MEFLSPPPEKREEKQPRCPNQRSQHLNSLSSQVLKEKTLFKVSWWCLPDTLSLLGEKKSQGFIAKHQTQINSWQAPQDREGSRVKVPHGNSCKLSLNCRIDSRRELLLQLWAPKMAPPRPSRRHRANSQSIKMYLGPSAKDKTTPG